MDDLMTIEQTAAYLHMSRGALAQLRFTGKGPSYFKPSGKTVLYTRSNIDAWLERSERSGTSAIAA